MDHERTFSALRVRDFRLFWIAQIISLSGTWMQQVAIGWLVYDVTGSPFYLGLSMMFMSLPVMLFTLIGGITADRYPKRNIILFAQILFMVPAFLFGLLAGTGGIKMWQVFSLVFTIGTLNAFDIPARQSFLVELVGKGNLLNAIALNSAAFNGARVIGPMLAGIVIAVLGVRACFFINALSYLPVVYALSLIRDRGTESVTGRKSVMRELGEGLLYIRKEKEIFILFTVLSVISLFGLPYGTFLPVIAEDVLRTGAQGLGRLGASAGMGALTAAMIIAVKRKVRRRFLYSSVAALCAGISIFLVTFSTTEAVSLILLGFAGWGMVTFLALSNNVIQQSVPDGLRGRVMSVYILVFLGMAPFGNMIVGALADVLGTMHALRVAAVICIMTVIAYLVRRARSGRPVD